MFQRALLFVFTALFSVAAHAEFDPMIEVGSGVSTGITTDGLAGVDVLLRAGFSLNQVTGEVDPVLGPEQFVLARITADFSVGTDGGPETLRVLNIRLIPLSSTVMLGNSGDVVTMGGLELLPMEFSRNVYIDNEFSVDLHVLGARFGNRLVVNEKFSLYMELAGKLLGYKMRNHLDETLGTFHGFSLAELGGEIGAAFQLGEVGMRIFVGGKGDVAFGSGAGTAAVSSDLGAYAGLAVDISEVVRKAIPWVSGMSFFVKAAYDADVETTGDGPATSAVLLGGFSIFF